MNRRIAIFDFDGTLIRGDSFGMFALFARGRWRSALAAILSLPWIIAWQLRLIHSSKAKERIFLHLFKGMTLEQFCYHGRAFADRISARKNPVMMRIAGAHMAQGNETVILSASMRQWIEPWALSNGFQRVIATEPEFDEATGRLTGHFATPNCHGAEKCTRLRQAYPDIYLMESWAYGDSDSDEPVLAMTTHPTKVRR